MPQRNQKVKKLGHIVLSIKEPCSLWPSAWQSREGLRGRRNSTLFSVGGLVVVVWACCDYSVACRLKPLAHKLLLSVRPTDWRDWEDPKEARRQTQLCESGGQVLSGAGQLLFLPLCSHPIPSPTTTTTLPLHMLTGHMLIRLVNMTANVPSDGWWWGGRKRKASFLKSYDFTADSLAYLAQAVYDRAFVSNLTGPSFCMQTRISERFLKDKKRR